jgi:hypothetical protein
VTRRFHPRFDSLDPFTSGRIEFAPGKLRFGLQTYQTADIASFRIESGERSGLLGSICACTLFLCLAAIMMQAIVGQILPYRTLIGVATLAFVALASMQDAWLERGHGFFKLFLTLKSSSGDVMVFATSQSVEVEQVSWRLAEALDEHAEPSQKTESALNSQSEPRTRLEPATRGRVMV